MDLGRDALRRAINSDWFDWSQGSSILFWRWPPECLKDVTKGSRFGVTKELPRSWEAQLLPKNQQEKERLLEKVAKVIKRGYLEEGKVFNLTSFFSVPKGFADIRVVYDATKSLLNISLWAPNFSLPTIDTVLRAADFMSWFGDADLGEHFLNFLLDERLRSSAGVDVTAPQKWLWNKELKALNELPDSP